MSFHRLSETYIVPSLLDRLSDNRPYDLVEDVFSWKSDFEQYKQAVARDLEYLLNTRTESSLDFQRWPELKKSVLNYGLPDFSHLSTSSPIDRQLIQHRVQEAIEIFEPRLRQVTVSLITSSTKQAQFSFRIEGMLIVRLAKELVMFDAVLEIATQRYTVN